MRYLIILKMYIFLYEPKGDKYYYFDIYQRVVIILLRHELNNSHLLLNDISTSKPPNQSMIL
jgi:hypothetical protein